MTLWCVCACEHTDMHACMQKYAPSHTQHAHTQHSCNHTQHSCISHRQATIVVLCCRMALSAVKGWFAAKSSSVKMATLKGELMTSLGYSSIERTTTSVSIVLLLIKLMHCCL